VNLNSAVLSEIMLNLKDRSPEDRFGCDIFSKPEGSIRVIFGPCLVCKFFLEKAL
jgi:hypothetical protein